MYNCHLSFRHRQDVMRNNLVSRQVAIYTTHKRVPSITEYYKLVEEGKNMLLNKRFFCGSKKTKAKVHPSIHENSILALTIKRLFELDKKIAAIRKMEGVEPFCTEGCNECCHDYFYISQMEYFVLRFTLLQKQRLDEMVAFGKNALHQLGETYPSEYEKIKTTESRIYNDHEFLEHFVLCPLNENGLCSCYNHRPITCRIYGNNAERGCCNKIKRFLKKDDGSIDENKLERSMISEWFVNDEYTFCIEDFPVMRDGKPLTVQGNMLTTHTKLAPLIYWLATDESFSTQYNDAAAMSVEAYCEKYFSIDE